MDLLVSLCNRDEEHPEAVVFVDTVAGTTLPVDLPEKGLGAMGLALLGPYLFVVVRLGRPAGELERSRLYALAADSLTPLAEYDFELGRDVHSLYPLQGALYAVSTGTDELLRLTLDGPDVVAEEVHWRPDSSAPRADVHHLNSLYFYDGALVVSGFGARPEGADWKDARAGGLWHLGRGERFGPSLYQPHSMIARGRQLLVCESPRRLIRALDGSDAVALSSYTRGLALEDEDVWVGLSQGRQQSKSSGVIHNLAAPEGTPTGECGLVRLGGERLLEKETLSLERFGREVYELLPLSRPYAGA
jgi:hypothetical protein